MRCDLVICSPNDEKFNKVTRSMTSCGMLSIESVVRISDAKGMCEGYNRGASQCRSEWVIFCHDDIGVASYNPASITAAFRTQDMFGVCGSARLVGADWYDSAPEELRGSIISPTPSGILEWQVFGEEGGPTSPVQALDGVFIACRRELWCDLRFDESLSGFTGYDIDFTYRAYLSGASVAAVQDLILLHESHPGEFSEDKLRKWELNQKIIRRKFQLPGVNQGYLKHRNLGVDGDLLMSCMQLQS